jgi:transcriptional regulator with XRE-family HTH domain
MMSTTTGRDTTFGDWLRATLADGGRGPDQLARYLGLDRGRITRWLNGRERPTPEQCERLATGLGVPARTVLTRAGHRATPTIAAARPVEATAPPAPQSTNGPASPPPSTRSDAMSAPDDVATAKPATDEPAAPEEPAPPAPAAAPRRRRPSRPAARVARADQAAPPAASAPPAFPPAPAPERIAALRVLVDELDAMVAAYRQLQSEHERLRQECGRLTAENEHLQAQIERVRAALALDSAPRP